MNYLPCEIVETGENPTKAVIWLHGLGASGHDFVPIVPHLNLPDSVSIRFVFPHAPSIPVTINGGYVMPAWYDIIAMDIDRKIDHAQIEASSNAVKALIEREMERGIKSEDIVLAGFSQGGAVCYEAALSFDKPLAGLMAMSTYFATHETIQLNDANCHLPICLFHGANDPVVQEVMGKNALKSLTEKGFSPSYHSYSMEHEVCMEEIQDISRFLRSALSF